MQKKTNNTGVPDIQKDSKYFVTGKNPNTERRLF